LLDLEYLNSVSGINVNRDIGRIGAVYVGFDVMIYSAYLDLFRSIIKKSNGGCDAVSQTHVFLTDFIESSQA
jgi:hypothetical protein